MSSLEGENSFLRIAGVYLQDQPVSRPKKTQPDIFRQNAVLATFCYFYYSQVFR
jgi:hypothetical protein